MDHTLFCPGNLANSISAVVDDGGNVSGWVRKSNNPIEYLSGRVDPVDVECAARGMINIANGLFIFSIGGHNGTFLCDTNAGGAIYPIDEDIIPFCCAALPNNALVLDSKGQLKILNVRSTRLCDLYVVVAVKFPCVAVHRLQRPGDAFRVILCRSAENGGISVELWEMWTRTDTFNLNVIVYDVCVTGDPTYIAVLTSSKKAGRYSVWKYKITNTGLLDFNAEFLGQYNLGKPPFHLAYVDGPCVVIWDGDCKVFVRNLKGKIIEYESGSRVRVCMRKANGEVLKYRDSKVFLHRPGKPVIEYGEQDRLQEEVGDVVVYSGGMVPYAVKPFGDVHPDDGVLVMNVLGGKFIGTVLGVNEEVFKHFRDIPAQRKPANRDPCYSLVVNLMSFVWWLDDSQLIVYNNEFMFLRWAASTVSNAMYITLAINQPVAIANKYVQASSFVAFVTDREFPAKFAVRFVLLISSDDVEVKIPLEFSKQQRQCEGFRILGHDGDPIPEAIVTLTEAILWINRL